MFKRVWIGLGAGIFLLLTAPAAMGALAGDLDPSFSGDGQQTTDFGAIGFARGLAIQPDGRIVLVGDSDDNLALARYNVDGSLDTTFGNDATPGDGKVVVDVMGSDLGRDVVVAPDGSIVAAVQASNNVALAKFNPDGSPDTAFGDGGDGEIVFDFGTVDAPYAVALDGSRIVLAGERDGDFFVSRHDLAMGNLDGTFNPMAGWVSTDIGTATTDSGRDVLIQSASRILVGGYGADTFALARYTSAGTLDPAFGNDGTPGDGKALMELPDANIEGIAAAPGGKIVAGGSATGSYAVGRFNDDGSPDSSFSGDGHAEVPLINMSGGGHDVAVQADGKVLFSGSGGGDFALLRFNTDGTLDTGFHGDGIRTVNFSGSDVGSAVALQADGKIVVGGATGDPQGDFAVVRLLAADDPVATARCAGRATTRSGVLGTKGRDVLVGTAGSDRMRGRGGNDLLCGGRGKDLLIGGPGNDVLRGEAGKDRLIGGKGKDKLKGGPGRDRQRQ